MIDYGFILTLNQTPFIPGKFYRYQIDRETFSNEIELLCFKIYNQQKLGSKAEGYADVRVWHYLCVIKNETKGLVLI